MADKKPKPAAKKVPAKKARAKKTVVKTPPRRSALTSVYKEGVFGRELPGGPGVTISERRNLSITQVAAFADTAGKAGKAIEKIAGAAPPKNAVSGIVKGGVHVLWSGPDRWWIVESDARDIGPDLAAALGDAAAVVSLGHSRTCLRVSGPSLRDLLAKGSTYDFHPSSFMPGDCIQTGMAHIGVTLHCLSDKDGSPMVDIYVLRSFAQHYYEWLTHSAAEYGYRVDAPILGQENR